MGGVEGNDNKIDGETEGNLRLASKHRRERNDLGDMYMCELTCVSRTNSETTALAFLKKAAATSLCRAAGLCDVCHNVF